MPIAYHPNKDINDSSSKATGYLLLDPIALRHYISVVLLLTYL